LRNLATGNCLLCGGYFHHAFSDHADDTLVNFTDPCISYWDKKSLTCFVGQLYDFHWQLIFA
jgi:hypothetical protein